MKAIWYVLMAAGFAIGNCGRAQPPEDGAAPWREKADGERMGGGPDRGDMVEMFVYRMVEREEIARKVGLDDAQVAALRDGLFSERTKAIELRAEQEKAAVEQAKLLMQPNVDEAAVMAMVEKAGAARTEMAKLRVRNMILIKKTLKPEQIEKAKHLLREHFERRHDAGRDFRRDKERDRGPGEPWDGPRAPGGERRKRHGQEGGAPQGGEADRERPAPEDRPRERE